MKTALMARIDKRAELRRERITYYQRRCCLNIIIILPGQLPGVNDENRYEAVKGRNGLLAADPNYSADGLAINAGAMQIKRLAGRDAYCGCRRR